MRVLNGHPKSVIGLAFSPDGRYLASASNDGSSLLYDSENDYRAQVLREADQGMTIYRHQVQFSADSRTLVGLDPSFGLRVWNMTDGSPHALLEATVGSNPPYLACSPTSPLVLALHWGLGGEKTPSAWSLDTCEKVAFWPDSPAPTGPVAFDPTGTWLACGDGVIRGISDGKEFRQIGYRPGSALAWHGGTRSLLAAVWGKSAEVFDPATGEHLAQVRLDRMEILAFAFTTDGRFFVTISNERTVKIWCTTDWKLSETLDWRVGKLESLALSPDGMRAATGSERGRIVVWDLD
jgi:WD40 repeat protein